MIQFNLTSNRLNLGSSLSTRRWDFPVDEEASKEIRRYNECRARLEKAKQMLANVKPGTKEYECFKLACMCFGLVLEIGWQKSKDSGAHNPEDSHT